MNAPAVATRDGTDLAWDDARSRAHDAVYPLPPVRRQLAAVVGAVLAAPLVAAGPLPPVDRSAMDGYAVCGPGPWTVVRPPLGSGEACAVVTGAVVPAGADAVVRDEDVVRDGSRVFGASGAGRHIRRAGEEAAADEVLVAAGTAVHPPVIGLAAALGHDELWVHPLPRVAAFVTGGELVGHGRPALGQVRDAIGPMLPGLLRAAGAGAVALEPLPDRRSALLAALAAADADLLVVTGSSAAGPADHLRGALAELGATLVVDGVVCRPGHPQALALLPDGRPVIGLPGNPLAALAAFLTLAGPVLATLRGAASAPLATVPGELPRHPTSTRLVPVRTTVSGVEPTGYAGAAMLRGAALADAFAVVAPGRGIAATVRLLPFDPGAHRWAG